jgi:hypothetical protein
MIKINEKRISFLNEKKMGLFSIQRSFETDFSEILMLGYQFVQIIDEIEHFYVLFTKNKQIYHLNVRYFNIESHIKFLSHFEIGFVEFERMLLQKGDENDFILFPVQSSGIKLFEREKGILFIFRFLRNFFSGKSPYGLDLTTESKQILLNCYSM